MLEIGGKLELAEFLPPLVLYMPERPFGRVGKIERQCAYAEPPAQPENNNTGTMRTHMEAPALASPAAHRNPSRRRTIFWSN